MLNGKKIAVVLPGYNCEKTLEATYSGIPAGLADYFIYVDDESGDESIKIAQKLGIKDILRHKKNMGYGANQKTCYWAFLKSGADIVVMIHPDYQYEPKLLMSMVSPIAFGVYDVMIGSRILGNKAIQGGMPFYKYLSNRFLTFFENILLNAKLSEYHTGYRAFSREVIESLPLLNNSDDFVFDNQMLSQVLYRGFRIGELSCPTKYFPEASSINISRSVIYGFGCIKTALAYRFSKIGLIKSMIFSYESEKAKASTNTNGNFEVISTSGFLTKK